MNLKFSLTVAALKTAACSVLAFSLLPTVALAAYAQCGPGKFATRDGVTLSTQVDCPSASPQGVVLFAPGSGNVGLDGDISGPFTEWATKARVLN